MKRGKRLVDKGEDIMHKAAWQWACTGCEEVTREVTKLPIKDWRLQIDL